MFQLKRRLMVVEHVGLEEVVELHFPLVAHALYEVLYPALLLRIKCPPAVFVLIVHVGTVQISGDGLAHGGVILVFVFVVFV